MKDLRGLVVHGMDVLHIDLSFHFFREFPSSPDKAILADSSDLFLSENFLVFVVPLTGENERVCTKLGVEVLGRDTRKRQGNVEPIWMLLDVQLRLIVEIICA